MFKKNRIIKYIIMIFAIFIIFFVISNLLIIGKGKKKISNDEEMRAFDADCILIFGAGVWPDRQPSPMLADRLDEGIRLYRAGVSKKILVSGDHGDVDYDEVNVMKNYLVNAGIPAEDIFMDHAGFSTYESIYRAKEIFGVQKVILVTQEYHMHRAVYICNKLGIDSLGSPSDPRAYAGAFARNAREWIARDKDIFYCLFKVKPTFLGDAIDLSGNGNVTNDK